MAKTLLEIDGRLLEEARPSVMRPRRSCGSSSAGAAILKRAAHVPGTFRVRWIP
jgi:hypothetical protein